MHKHLSLSNIHFNFSLLEVPIKNQVPNKNPTKDTLTDLIRTPLKMPLKQVGNILSLIWIEITTKSYSLTTSPKASHLHCHRVRYSGQMYFGLCELALVTVAFRRKKLHEHSIGVYHYSEIERYGKNSKIMRYVI